MNADMLIVRLAVEPRWMLLFQALLQGEEDLAVVRHGEPGACGCELWLPACRERELMDWIGSLPGTLKVRLLSTRHVVGEVKCGD
ncbi:MAG: hypothetical protein D6678_00730 [Zetaproteobacteria bacterium]|nr:MAG: hypothetical protein D6678_00730 [Zetaproteobacteria bacterium]